MRICKRLRGQKSCVLAVEAASGVASAMILPQFHFQFRPNFHFGGGPAQPFQDTLRNTINCGGPKFTVRLESAPYPHTNSLMICAASGHDRVNPGFSGSEGGRRDSCLVDGRCRNAQQKR